MLQLTDGLGVFFIQRIDVLQDSLGSTIALCLLIDSIGLLALWFGVWLWLVPHGFVFKGQEAETNVLGLPDHIVFDFAKLFLLREGKMLPGGVVVVLVQLIPNAIPGFIALGHLWLLGQLIHDVVHQGLQGLLQIAVLLFPACGFQGLYQLAHVLLNDGAVAQLMCHLANQLPHGVLGRLREFLVGNILSLVERIHLIPEDAVGQLGAHGRNAVSGQEALLGMIGPHHHVNVRVMSLVVEGCVPAEVIGGDLHSLG